MSGVGEADDKPSFDEIVELVSTGQADRIPGIKDIPLKINEAEPSKATMQRPLKPWEKSQEQPAASELATEQQAQQESNTEQQQSEAA